MAKTFKKIAALFLVILISKLITPSYGMPQGDYATDTARVNRLLGEASDYFRTLPDSALLFVDSALTIAQDVEYSYGLMRLNNLKGLSYQSLNNNEQSHRYYNIAYKLAREIKDSVYMGLILNNIGVLLNKHGSVDSALHYHLLAHEVLKKTDDMEMLGKVLTDIGSIYTSRDQFDKAVEYLNMAGLAFRKAENYIYLTILNINLGRLYQKIESCERSLDYYETALKYDSLTEITSFHSIITNNIGELYFRCFENIDSATKYYNASLRISINSGNESGIVSTRVNLGNVYYENKEYEKALKNYKSVLIYDVARENKAMYSPILINIGIAYEKLQQPDSAVPYLNKGLALAKELGFMEYQFNAYSSLLAVDSARNDVISAMHNIRKMLEIKDSIWNSDVAEKIAEIEIQSATEKKELEKQLLLEENVLKEKVINRQWLMVVLISISFLLAVFLIIVYYRDRRKLKRLNHQVNESNKQLRELNNTKDKFFSIIAHDLRSPFDALLGLLTELDENYETFDEDFKKEIIKSLRKSSHNTYNLLVNLLDWSRSKRGKIKNEPEKVNVSLIIHRVFDFLETRAEEKKQQLLVETDSKLHVYADPQLLQNVLINLVNNSIKFTAVGGKIRVAATLQQEIVKICVEDNGIGIPKKNISRLFSIDGDTHRKGTESELGTGLGLVMCKEFVEIMGGAIKVESEEGKGSTFCITLPSK